MKTLFYRYALDFRSKNANEQFHPDERMKHRLVASMVKMKIMLVPTVKYADMRPLFEKEAETNPETRKMLEEYGEGPVIADWLFGSATFDERTIGVIGWDSARVTAQLEEMGGDMGLKVLTNEEMAAHLREMTTLSETEPGLFLVAEAVTEGPFLSDAKYIDLR